MIAEILRIVAGVGERFFESRDKQLEFENEVSKALISNQAELNKSMAKVMSADAASEGWFTRNIRPIAVGNMLVLLNAIVVTAILAPNHVDKVLDAIELIPSQLWTVILGGIGLYSVLRTGEKIIRRK